MAALAMASMAADIPMIADIPTVDIPTVDVYYVQAHGGGTNSLKNVITTYNNYDHRMFLSPEDIKKSGEGFKINNPVFPMIGRLVSPGKSANSDFDSDKQTVNYIRNILSNDAFRNEEMVRLSGVSANTRTKSGAYTEGEGYRRFGELIDNISLYSANEPIFNETVEVELISGRIFAGKEDVKENPGGFGIWKCGGNIQGWKYLSTETKKILLTGEGNSKDIQILEIVRQLTIALKNKNIIVIFPNCSPFGVESWTSSQRRAVRNPKRISSGSGESKSSAASASEATDSDGLITFEWEEEQQFQQMLLMLSRIQNFYQGNRNFKMLLETDKTSFTTSCEKYEKDPKTDKEKTDKWIEGPIGVMDKDDSKFLYSVITYFISKYPLRDDFLNNDYFINDNNEFLYASNRLGYVKGIDFIMYVYLILFLAFTVNESNGGIFRDTDDRKTLSNLNSVVNRKIDRFIKNDDASQELRKPKIKEIRDCLILSDMLVNQSMKYGSRIDAWNNLKIIAKGLSLIDEVDVGGGGGGGGESKLSSAAAMVSHYGGIKRKKRTRKNKRKKKKGKKKKTRKKRKTKRKR